ncbi:MAG: acyltransferase [Acidaminococcaceae bacterium]
MGQRNKLIDNLRGICMLGVIAIHAGSSIALSASPNVHIYMLFEVLSRYSVPAFFFISGYGLFASYGLYQNLDYLPYLQKRFKSVGLPYVIWSILYLLYYQFVTPGSVSWSPFELFFTLFFGLASYHIYFMVILLWFYLLFPCWRLLLRWMHKISLPLSLTVLFFLQLGINYWTCHYWSYPAWIAENQFLLNMLNYRLNYLPFHYLFVFIMGALAAIHYEIFLNMLRTRFRLVTAFFTLTVILMSSRFYYLLNVKHLDLESITNTLQQLSPEGFLYTVSSLLFFSAVLCKAENENIFLKLNDALSNNSYIIYLIHPFFLDQVVAILARFFKNSNDIPAFLTYFSVLILSMLASLLIKKLGKQLPLVSLLLTGKNR